MKYFAAISIEVFLMIFFSFSSGMAEFAVPDYVYTVDRLQQAQDQAKNNKKQITFVGSDKNSTCPLTKAATEDIFQGLKEYSVIVYVEYSDLERLPDLVSDALNSSEAGQYIPKTVIVTQDIKEVISILPYAEAEERKELIKKMQE